MQLYEFKKGYDKIQLGSRNIKIKNKIYGYYVDIEFMTMFTLVDFSGAGLKNLGLIKVNTHRVGICNFFQTIKLF